MNFLDLSKEEIFALLCAVVREAGKNGVVTLENVLGPDKIVITGSLTMERVGNDFIFAFHHEHPSEELSGTDASGDACREA